MITRQSATRLAVECAVLAIAPAFASGQALHWASAGPPPRIEHYGAAAVFVADVDGDGVADLLIGTQPLVTTGRAELRSGATGALLHEWDGVLPGDAFGSAVADVGDTDGDGTTDLLVGAPFFGGGAAQGGAAYVYSGASGALLLTLVGTTQHGHLGASAAAVGDLNADGSSDFVLGEPGLDTALVISGADGSTLWTLTDASGSASFGTSVDGAGDLDLDGVPDVLVGAPFHASGVQRGALFAFSGASGALLFVHNDPTKQNGFGMLVRRGNDVDGDGRPDPIVTNPCAWSSWGPTGELHVVSGANGAVLHTLEGSGVGYFIGNEVSRTGDFDGDGIGDFIAWGRETSPEFFLYSGATAALIQKFDDPNYSVAIDATADLDQDGTDDFLIGTPLSPAWQTESAYAGRVVVRSGASGTNLLELHGLGKREQRGLGVAILDDVNGDGTRDVAVGSAPQDGLGDVTILSGADASELAKLSSGVGGDRYGFAVTPLADLDGDGVADLAIGAPGGGTPPVAITGSVEIRSGTSGALLQTFAGVTIDGRYGSALASARDASGDVVLMVGAPHEQLGGGPAAGTVELLDLTSGASRFKVGGLQDFSEFGAAVAAVGDVNGDGFVDFAVGAPNTGFNYVLQTGAAYLVSGKDGTTLFTWSAPFEVRHFGTSVCGPGDLDGDGVPDAAVGAPEVGFSGVSSGRVDLFSGKTGVRIYKISGPDFSGRFGATMARIGDLDRDGFEDFAVGAPTRDTSAASGCGAVYLFSGRHGLQLYRFDGANQFGDYGLGLASLAYGFDGDVTGDAIPDLVIGAPNDTATTTGVERGRVELHALAHLYLQADPLDPATGATLTLATRDGPAGRLAGLYAVAIDGTPMNVFLVLGHFNATGAFDLAGTTPPGISGHTLTLRSYAIGFGGRIVDSQDVTIAFQ